MRTTSSLLLSLAAAALLAGCASGPTTYTTSVQSYSGMAGVQLPTTYRSELLPSQVQNQQSFGVIEASAQQALDQVGLRPAADPTQAHLVVQIDAISVANTTTPYNDSAFYAPPGVYGWGYGRPWTPGPWGPGPFGPGPAMAWATDFPSTVYHRSVNLVMRDAKTQRIVYETSAQYNDMQGNDPQIWGILFSSALNDFPNPPQGVRQVQTTIAPATPTAPASSK